MNSISTQLPLPKGTEIDSGHSMAKVQNHHRPESVWQSDKVGETERLSGSEIKELVAMIQDHLNSLNINVNFSTYGEERTRTAVVVTERDTGEIIREFPPEELQKLHLKMEELLGMIFSSQA